MVNSVQEGVAPEPAMFTLELEGLSAREVACRDGHKPSGLGTWGWGALGTEALRQVLAATAQWPEHGGPRAAEHATARS